MKLFYFMRVGNFRVGNFKETRKNGAFLKKGNFLTISVKFTVICRKNLAKGKICQQI
jgi:hypothetical protein